MDGSTQPGFQKTLDRHGDFRNLRGRPQRRGDVDDESAHGFAHFDLAHGNGGTAPFLFVDPARRVLADKANRQKFVCTIYVWLAAVAGGLALLGWLHLLNPCLILAGVSLLGVGFASCSYPGI